MTLTEFINNVQTQARQRGFDTVITTVEKNHTTKVALQVCREIAPILYIEDMYKENYSIPKVLDIIENNVETTPLFDQNSLSKENVFVHLVSRKNNKEFLKEVVHVPFLDMEIVMSVLIQKDEAGIQKTKLTKDLAMQLFGTTEGEEILEVAKKNTVRLFPPTINRIGNFIPLPMEDNTGMTVVSNESCINGATAILYNGVLKEISDTYGKDIAVLPSSIHEVICLPYDIKSIKFLKEMVADINATVVSIEEVLTNNVYIYNRVINRITEVEE